MDGNCDSVNGSLEVADVAVNGRAETDVVQIQDRPCLGLEAVPDLDLVAGEFDTVGEDVEGLRLEYGQLRSVGGGADIRRLRCPGPR